MANINIDGKSIIVQEGTTILNAALNAGIYIPMLCSHPDLKPFQSLELSETIYQGDKVYTNEPDDKIDSIKGCGLCIVEIEGKEMPVPSCKTFIEDGMLIKTNSEELQKRRRQNLVPIMGNHPHSCLTCSQREGCLTLSADCSNSVILNERCCEINGNCEIQRISNYIGIASETPKYHHQGIPRIVDEGLFLRDYNLCISCGRCVRACQQLRNVYALGAVINDGKLVIGTVNGPHLSDADCRFCGACVEVCPTGAIQDIRKPRLKEFNDYVPCRANCPGSTDIPAYLKLISEGNYQGSAEVISSRLSFPNSLGKICFHPCETDCRRNTLNGALSIRLAKDFVMNRSDVKTPDRINLTEKKVAVIGAGPAGLTTAYYLSLNGHEVTVYEKENNIGGMLRYGIPRYRLSEETLYKDLKFIEGSGIQIKTGVNIGKDITISSLLNNGNNAVYLATGLSESRRLPINIDASENIYYGVEFLNKVSKYEINSSYFSGKEVVIIGGGNVATDAARTAIRLAAQSVKIICLEKAEEMPAYADEITESLEEGIIIHNGWGIENITVINDNSLEINLIKCSSVFDEKGLFSPKYDDTITNTIYSNALIICIGQQSVQSVINDNENLNLFERGLIKVKSGSFETNVKGLFAGGDIVSGPKSVIDAIGMAKKAAREIDKYLGGNGIISGDDFPETEFKPQIGKIEGFCKFERMSVELKDADHRKNNFEQVELGYDDITARMETARCLQCNLRLKIGHNPYPPKKFREFNYLNIEKVDSEEGVVQLLNADKEVFLIKGTENMKETLFEFLKEGKEACYFIYEFDPLFSKRESELIQQYLQKHGEMPDSGDDLDDLF